MHISLLLFVLTALPANTQPAVDLFDVLDKNNDGRIVSSELSESQRPYFTRALRVSDQNEDGMLTRDELALAVTEPEKMVISSPVNRRTDFDLARLDVNGDGVLSKREVPQPLRQRLQRAFDTYGKDEIPIEDLRRMAQGLPPVQKKENSEPEKMKSAGASQPFRISSEQLASAVRRLDKNKDGKLSRQELQKAPFLSRALDRNRDGEVTAGELALARQVLPKTDPRTIDKRTEMQTEQGAKDQRLTPETAAVFFGRMDADGNGTLSREEIPERMRQKVSQIDRNNDKLISREEFVRAVRSLQNRRK